MERESSISGIDHSKTRLVGGRLAVDFANAVLQFEEPENAGSGWRALIGFLVSVGNISNARAATLLDLVDFAADETVALFETALDLRDAIRRSLRARMEGA